MAERIRKEIGSMSLFDKIYMVSMLALQIVVYVIQPDSILGIISGISGVISVVLCAKRRISFYFVGFIQTISYLILAYQNRFYGEVIENLFYLVTMIWGICIWKSNSDDAEDGAVKAKRFTLRMWIQTLAISAAATILAGTWLESIGSAQPFTDAATNVLAIIAQLLMIWRYREQWAWWLCIDVLCIKLWAVAGNWSMIAMYIAWTINCIYGWVNWSKQQKG